MAEGTKERILRIALELFAQNGYLGTSMNDIAGQLGFTKAALYKHYASKQEILDKIVEQMNRMDHERAEAYEMPETEPDGFAEAYLHTPIQKIHTYSLAQFDHWTKEPFSSNFRKMLTLEQYRDPKLAQLQRQHFTEIGGKRFLCPMVKLGKAVCANFLNWCMQISFRKAVWFRFRHFIRLSALIIHTVHPLHDLI